MGGAAPNSAGPRTEHLTPVAVVPVSNCNSASRSGVDTVVAVSSSPTPLSRSDVPSPVTRGLTSVVGLVSRIVRLYCSAAVSCGTVYLFSPTARRRAGVSPCATATPSRSAIPSQLGQRQTPSSPHRPVVPRPVELIRHKAGHRRRHPKLPPSR